MFVMLGEAMEQLSKNKAKIIKSLHRKKSRRELGLFIAEGPKVCAELFASTWEVEMAVIAEGTSFELAAEIPFYEATQIQMKQLSALQTPNEIMAIAKIPQEEEWVPKFQKPVLVLDNIRDPGNLGTLIRLADWFGAEAVLCSPETVDCFNPKALQSTMGSLFHLPVHYGDLAGILQKTRGFANIYAADLGGNDLYGSNPSANGYLILGSESHGISPELEPFIDQHLTIKGRGMAESLNVAVAGAIAFSEFFRPR